MHTHFVGIAGVGMAPLAAVLIEAGEVVSGCDRAVDPTTRLLAEKGVRVYAEQSVEHLRGVDRLVFTGPTMRSPEVEWAREQGLEVLKRPELLGLLMDERRGIAVAGTHGKTTTTSLLSAMLMESGLDPSVVIGGVPAGWRIGGRYGRGEWLVAEADEYDRAFLPLRPEVAVVTSIEMDHPDTFASLEDMKAAFRTFLGGVRAGGAIFAGAGDAAAVAVACDAAGAKGLRLQTYGLEDGADWVARVRARSAGHTEFEIRHAGGVLGDLHTSLPGDYNLANAAGATAVALSCGATEEGVRAALRTFAGVGRRWELKGEARDVVVVDDYAHHPSALVDGVITNGRELYPDRELWLAFQPHTFSRTRELLGEFAEALRLADRAYVLEIYAGRERPDPEISGEHLARLVEGAVYAGDVEQAARHIAADARPGVLLVTVGAGDVTDLGPKVLGLLEAGGER
jgi:UDP-N-acetylmuramate--alanine ligase